VYSAPGLFVNTEGASSLAMFGPLIDIESGPKVPEQIMSKAIR
jgi:hypothetical protein